jgi:hypothetical protein
VLTGGSGRVHIDGRGCVDSGSAFACVYTPGLGASVDASGACIETSRPGAGRVVDSSGSIEEGDDDDNLEGCHFELRRGCPDQCN